MRKNTATKLLVFAWYDPDSVNSGEPVTGEAANITCNVHIDGGAANAVDDTNPTELSGGYYLFDLTAAETNGDHLAFIPAITTTDALIRACPEAVYTSGVISVDSNGIVDSNISKVNDVTVTGDGNATPWGPA